MYRFSDIDFYHTCAHRHTYMHPTHHNPTHHNPTQQHNTTQHIDVYWLFYPQYDKQSKVKLFTQYDVFSIERKTFWDIHVWVLALLYIYILYIN